MSRDAASAPPPTVAASASEPYLTVEDVAAILRVTPRTVVRAARDGSLEHVRVTVRNGYRFKRSDVEKYIAAKTAELAAHEH